MGEVAGSIPARSTIQLEEPAQRNLWVRRKGCSSTEQILGPMPVSGRPGTVAVGPCPGGEIGRRGGFKIPSPLWACRFKSCPGYSLYSSAGVLSAPRDPSKILPMTYCRCQLDTMVPCPNCRKGFEKEQARKARRERKMIARREYIERAR